MLSLRCSGVARVAVVSNDFFEIFSTWIAVFHEASTLKGSRPLLGRHGSDLIRISSCAHE